MEKELNKFYIAVEQTADGVFITDAEGLIQYVNSSFEKMTGFTKQEVLGKTPKIIKSGIHNRTFYKNLWTTITSGKTFRSTVINKKKNKELFYTDHTITPLKDDKNNITHYVGIWKDISQQIHEEQRKADFISMISHELKTPVTTIRAFLQILQKRAVQLQDPRFSHILIKTQNQVSNLITLTEDLLDVIRIQEGKLAIQKKTFLF